MAKKFLERLRGSNKRIIESKNPKFEHGFVKYPLERLRYASTQLNPLITHYNTKKIFKRIKRKGGKYPPMWLHTHPYYGDRPAGTPSYGDALAIDAIGRTSVILQRDPEGKLAGYTMLFKKSRHVGKYSASKEEIRHEPPDSDFADLIRRTPLLIGEKYSRENVSNRLKSFGIDVRFHPMKGYYFDDSVGRYEKKEHNLEGAVASVLLGSVLLFLLLKIPLTGSVVSNISSSSFGFGFVVLLVLAFGAGIYFLLKPHKKK